MSLRWVVGLIVSLQCVHAADWRSELTPDRAGPLRPVRPFEAEYRFGWSDIDAARARVSISRDGETLSLSGSGSTTGLARVLWQLDATLSARSALPDFRTITSEQNETYARKRISTRIEQRPDGFWRCRQTEPGPTAKWKRIKLTPLRDLFSGMLFIRSQRLEPGESVQTVIFPGDSPFFVKMTCIAREPIVIGGEKRPALRLDVQLQRINVKEGDRLERHPKFQRGQVWISDDADRIPLRAEVSIFVGYVFGEITSLKFP